MSEQRTVAGEVVRLAAAGGARPAVLSKRYGRWIPRSRAEVAESVGEVAAGLRALGLAPGDAAGLLLAPHSAWVAADLGAQAAGLRVTALPVGSDPAFVADVLGDAGVRVVFVQRAEVADLVLGLSGEGRLPALAHVVYVDPAAVAEYVDPRLRSLDALRTQGREAGGGGLDALRALLAERDPSEVAALAYDADAPGPPRAAALTHAELLGAAHATVRAFGLGESDRLLAVRPLGDPVERGATIYAALVSGALLALPETPATIEQALYEIAPTYVHVTPRWLLDVAGRVSVRMQTAKGLKRAVNRRWARALRRAVTGGGTSSSWLGRALVAYPVREKLGLDRVRHVVASGAPLPAEALAFFRALGIPLRPAYGPAQAGGLVAASTGGTPGEADCGAPLEGFEVRAGEAGDLEVRGADGPWRRTWDLGELTDGRLSVTGRQGEELEVGGAVLRPGRFETAMRASPYLREAVLGVDGGRLVAAVELSSSAVGRWAARQELRYTTYAALTRLPEVRDLAAREVRATLERRKGPAVEEVRVLDRPLEEVPGALTAMGTARRAALWAAARDAAARDAAALGRPADGVRV